MPMSVNQLNQLRQELRGQFKISLENINSEADGIHSWVNEILEDLKSGTIKPGNLFFDKKTPVTSIRAKAKKRSKRALSDEFERAGGYTRDSSVEAIPETDETVILEAAEKVKTEAGEAAPPSEPQRTPDNVCFEPPKSRTKPKRTNSKYASKKDWSNRNGSALEASVIDDSHRPCTSSNEHLIQAPPDSSGVGADTVNNATFSLDKSDMGNSTFVIEPRETKIERGTFVIEKMDMDGDEVRKASDKAVLDAMSGPVRVTRTKARAIAQEAAVAEVARQSGHSVQSNQSGQSKHAEQLKKEAAVKAARKSIAKAKRIIITSVSATKKPLRVPEKLDQFNRKETGKTRVRCNSASEGKNNFSVLKQFKKGTLYGTPSRLPPHHPVGPHLSNIVVGMDSLIKSANSNSLSQHQSGAEKRIKEIDQKLQEAAKKKEEIIKQSVDAKAKKRQEKRQRVLSARDEHERERAMQQMLIEKDREEKLRVFHAEKEKQLLLERRKLQCKLEAAAEQRRMFLLKKEDNNYNKRLKLEGGRQMESEKKHCEHQQVDGRPEILLQQDGKVMTASHMMKKIPYQPEGQASVSIKIHMGSQPTDVLSQSRDISSYDLTLNPEDREVIPSKGPEDYGLDDVCTDDSSDDESQPKKAVPKWAQAGSRNNLLLTQKEVSYHQMAEFFGSKRSTPDLLNIFQDVDLRTLTRRSSAVWDQKFLTRH